MNSIKYIEKKIKYLLAEEYSAMTGIIGYDIQTDQIRLTLIGKLTIKKNYGWDGASGPTIDTDDSMRGSLEHDAFYELLRKGLLPQSERDAIDKRLEQVCKEDGMFDLRAEAWDFVLDWAGKGSADPKNRPEIKIAPKPKDDSNEKEVSG